MTDTEPPDLVTRLAALAGTDPFTERTERTADITRRATAALEHHGGHPNGAWSTGEQLAVAVVLDDQDHLAGMGYTREQAVRAVAGGMFHPPKDPAAWLAGIAATLPHPAGAPSPAPVTPLIYETTDVDEMTLGALAVLAELRTWLVATNTAAAVIETVDRYATEIVTRAADDNDGDEHAAFDDAWRFPPRATRTCLIPDFGPDELATTLATVEELLMTVRHWASDAQEPDGDRWRPPAQLNPDTLLPVVNRLQVALRNTQTRTVWDGPVQRDDVAPDGPSWQTTGGYPLAAITFVDLNPEDVDRFGALADALTGPGRDWTVGEIIDAVDDTLDLPVTMSDKDRALRGAVSCTTRVHALLTADTGDDDTELLHTIRTAAGDTVVLDTEQENAWHRVVNRCHAAFLPGDVLARWAMGNRDYL